FTVWTPALTIGRSSSSGICVLGRNESAGRNRSQHGRSYLLITHETSSQSADAGTGPVAAVVVGLASSGVGFVASAGLSVVEGGDRRDGLVAGFVLVAVVRRSRERAGSAVSAGSGCVEAGSSASGSGSA